jgi:hypothetical protein
LRACWRVFGAPGAAEWTRCGRAHA